MRTTIITTVHLVSSTKCKQSHVSKHVVLFLLTYVLHFYISILEGTFRVKWY